MSVEQLDVTALAFTSEQDDSRALLLIDLLMSLLGFPPTRRAMAILQYCSFVFAFAFASSQDDHLRRQTSEAELNFYFL